MFRLACLYVFMLTKVLGAMESNTSSPSLDNAEAKAAFRKPLNDTGTRHYRRRSPVGKSSSSEDSALKHDRSSSPILSREDCRRDIGSMRRKDDERDLDRNSGRIHHGRNGDTYRQSDRKFSKSSYNNHRRDTYDRRDKVIDAEERHYSKSSSYSGQESRSATHSDHAREENEHYRSRRHTQCDDKYSRDRTGGSRLKSRDNDIDERSDYRRGDNKYSRSPVHGSCLLRDKAGHRLNDPKDLDGQKYAEEKKKLNDQESSKQVDRSDKHPREQFKERSVFTCEKEDSPFKKRKPINLGNNFEKDADEGKSTKYPSEPAGKMNFEQAPASGCTAADIDAARKTAMKAAESVNKNLMGTGYMSADQKKKLLWGSKKSTPTEEQSIHRWDTATFSDREQQEKFNKLMGVKVELKEDHKPNNQGSGVVHAEKQKEMLLDLEKQYVAGLRRRDGRTVGLGL